MNTRYFTPEGFMQALAKHALTGIFGVAIIQPSQICAAELSVPQIERALFCDHFEDVYPVLTNLTAWMEQEKAAGRFTRESLTTLQNGSRAVLDYKYVEPVKIMGYQVVGLNNSVGALPALAVFFNGSPAQLRQPFEARGFTFQCLNSKDLQGETCEGGSAVPEGALKNAGQVGKYRFVANIVSGAALLPRGMTLVSCTILPAEGNPFR